MSDSPAVIPYDQDGQPLATEPGTPADKALTVQGDPAGAPISVTESDPIDVSALATHALQTAQTSELAAIATAVQGTLQVSGTVTATPSGTQDVLVTNVAHVVIDEAPASLATETTLADVKSAVESLDTKLTSPLPVTGSVTVDTSELATAALQTAGNASLASIDSKLDGPLDVSVSFPPSQDVVVSNVPHVVVDGTVTASIDTAALATAAKQDAGNAALASIDSKLTNPLPVSGSVTVDTSELATSALQTAGNASLASIDTKLEGPLDVTVDKTGLATTAGQATGNASLTSIDGKLPTLTAGKVPVDVAFPSVQPVSVASLPLATGAATSALQTTGNSSLSAINTKLPALGQAAMAASQPVAIASNQSAIPVSGSVTATISGTPSVSVSNFPSTQAVSIASQPLPTSASTSGLQATGNTSLASIDTKTPALVSGRVPVDATGTVTAAISGTPNVAVTSSVLPTDAASETTLSTRLSDATFTARVPTLGQATMAASSPVTIASNQPAIAVSGTVSAVVSGSTLTGGTQKAIARGGAKGSTAAADITSTAEGTNHQALDVQLYHGGAEIDPQQIRALSSGTDSVTCVPSGTQAVSIAAAVPVTDGGGSLTVDGTVTCVPSGTQTVSGTVSVSNFPASTQQVSGSLAANNTVTPTLLLKGCTGCGVILSGTAFVGTVFAQFSMNAGNNWSTTTWFDAFASSSTYGLVTTGDAFSFATGRLFYRSIVIPPGADAVRVYCSPWTSGSITATLSATNVVQVQPAQANPQSAGFQRVTDGTTVAAVAAASAGAASTDPALVVAMSPNVEGCTGGSPFIRNVTTTSIEIVSASATRQMVVFNNIGTSDVYMCFGPYGASLYNHTLKLAPGQYYEMFSTHKGVYRGTIRAATASDTSTLIIQVFS